MSKVVAAIPARYGSQRFPGKPLTEILGKPMIQWVYEAASTAESVDEAFVLTDHQGIFDLITKHGGNAIMTPTNLATGSDRISYAMEQMAGDIYLNIQGDEPLLDASMIDNILKAYSERKDQSMFTAATQLQDGELEDPNCVKVLLNNQGEAIYFSRLPIPYSRGKVAENCIPFKHVGLYVYQASFLKRYFNQGVTELESAESLEQLRALYMGTPIGVHIMSERLHGVDTPEDVVEVEKRLNERISFGGK